MSFVHGKNTVIIVAGFTSPAPTGSNDLSAYINTSTFTRGADSHDVTTYGKNDHVFSGGLKTGTFSMGGTYDSSTSAGPAAVLGQANGQTASITRRPEGTGTGKPAQLFSGVLTSYVETSPVADMVSWTAEFTVSDAVTVSTQ